eukprot:IDg15195t1
MRDLALKWTQPENDADGMVEWNKMVSSELYNCMVPYMINIRAEARRLATHYNSVLGQQKDMVQRAVQLGELF